MKYNQQTLAIFLKELEERGYVRKESCYKNETFGYWKSFGEIVVEDNNFDENVVGKSVEQPTTCQYQIAILIYDLSLFTVPREDDFPITVKYEFVIGASHVLDTATVSIADEKMTVKWFEVFCKELYDKLFEGFLFEKQKFVKWEATELLKKINRALGIDITQKNRKRLYVYARFIFFHKVKKNTNMNLVDIGNLIGKDHASVIHGLKEYEKLKKYPDFNKIRNKINNFLLEDNNGTYLV